MGMVVVEAQCSGLRVVMSDKVPAESIVCPEMVTVKSTGIDPVLWADAISGNSSLVDRKCYAQKIWRSPFSIENSVSRLIGLYES